MTYESALVVDDNGKTFTAVAGGSILAGDLVTCTSGAYTYDSVGSRLTTFAGTEIVVTAGSNDTTIKQNCVGLALTDAASGSYITILKKGIVILPTGSTAVVAGNSIMPAGYGVGTAISHNNCAVLPLTAGAGSVFPIGKALTSSSAAGKFVVVSLNI